MTNVGKHIYLQLWNDGSIYNVTSSKLSKLCTCGNLNPNCMGVGADLHRVFFIIKNKNTRMPAIKK